MALIRTRSVDRKREAQCYTRAAGEPNIARPGRVPLYLSPAQTASDSGSNAGHGPTGEPLLTSRNVGDLLHVTPRTIQRWVREGWLKPVSVGPANRTRPVLRFTASDVYAAIEGRGRNKP